MSTSEEWRPVVGFEGSYEVSNMGRVRSVDRSWQQLSRGGTLYTLRKPGRILRPGRMPRGHLSVALGRGRSHCVHELVLRAFLGPPPPKTEARHLDGDEANNRFDNLVWDTRGNNTRDKKWHRGATTYKLSPAQIAAIKNSQTNPYFGQGADLALEYDVSQSTISCIKLEKIHTDVTRDRL